jgi:hypothetical protein
MQRAAVRIITIGLCQLMRWTRQQIYIKQEKKFFAASGAAVKVIMKQLWLMPCPVKLAGPEINNAFIGIKAGG